MSDRETGVERAFAVVESAAQSDGRRSPRRRQRIVVGPAAEIAPGGRRIVDTPRGSIGIFNVEGRFYAIRNVCPHQGAPLCAGTVHATHRPSAPGEYAPALAGRILRCPWHGWEFDILTGQSLHDPASCVATYPVEIDPEGNVILLI